MQPCDRYQLQLLMPKNQQLLSNQHPKQKLLYQVLQRLLLNQRQNQMLLHRLQNQRKL